MEMSHLGYIAYIGMVLLMYGSPVIVWRLYRAYKRGHVVRTLLLCVVTVPVLAAVLYAMFRIGLLVLAAISR